MRKEETLQQTLDQIGKRLVALRKGKGYTSHEIFCYDYDLPRMQYWRMENGKTNLTLKSLHRVLAIHDVTLEQFFMELNISRPKESKSEKGRSPR